MKTKPLLIVGGGLWGGLLAYRLKQTRPEVEFRLVETAQTFGGNHTWSFHGSDVSAEAFEWLKPFIHRSWEGYTVEFPGLTKKMSGSYHSISSERFHEVLNGTLSEQQKLLDTHMTDEELRELGSFVIDARNKCDFINGGYQKFVGREVELQSPHGLTSPILMDAKIKQTDWYRFAYYLPTGLNTVLVEDTRYSNHSHLDVESIKEEIGHLLSNRGWAIKHVIREEHGVLPLPVSAPEYSEGTGFINLAGIFHDTTGYSLPDAVRLIEQIVTLELDHEVVRSAVSDYRKAREDNRSFFRTLNRMLFEASNPPERYKIFEHFYQLSPGLIQRFYRGQFTALDRIRIFMGKPPVPVHKALQILVSKPVAKGVTV